MGKGCNECDDGGCAGCWFQRARLSSCEMVLWWIDFKIAEQEAFRFFRAIVLLVLFLFR